MASPLLWGPGLSNNLQPGINFSSSGTTLSGVQSGTVNPTTTATAGNPGSIYMNSSTGIIFTKLDSGTTTNWQIAFSTAQTVAIYGLTTNVAVTGGFAIKMDTLVYDPLGMYSTGTGNCIVPTAGVYTYSFVGAANSTATTVQLYKNGTPITEMVNMSNVAFNGCSVDVVCAAGDNIYVVSSGSVTFSGSTAPFSCYISVKKVANTSSGSGGSGLTRSVNTISTATTAGATALTDYVYLVSGTTTLTLPTAVGNTNLYTVKNIDASLTTTIATTSAQTIDGSTTITLPVSNTSVDLISDSANWRIV